MATVGPAHIDIVAWGNVKAATGTYTRLQDSSTLTGGHGYDSAGAINNYLTWDVPLIAGNWTITVIHYTNINRGIVTPSIAGTDLATYDGYSAGPVRNVVAQWTGVSVATSGVKEFKLRCDSKHASSSGYYTIPSLITFSNEDDPTTSFTCTGPSRIDIVPFGFWEHVVGDAGARGQISDSLGGGYRQTNTLNDETGWYVPLMSGTWALDVIYRSRTEGGIVTVSIDGSSVGTIDTYNAAPGANAVATITGISVASSKMALLKFTTTSKHASSAGYRFYNQHIALRKTA